MSQGKKNLVQGVAILSIAGIISKVIGAAFRVPLTNMIGADGIGIYTGGYSAYTLLLAVATSGIPVAISRLVAEYSTMGRYRQARHVLKTSLWLLALIGSVLTLLLIALSGPLSRATDPARAPGYLAIAPSILIVSVMSALRGYMQGRSRMTPTAVSQLIEQFAKVIISYPLAAYAMRLYGPMYAAAAALLGISIGEVLALLYMAGAYLFRRGQFLADEEGDTHTLEPTKNIVRQLIVIAVPIVVGSMIVPLATFIDSVMIVQRLETAGVMAEKARSLYGLLSSVNAVINIPTVLAMAVCVGLVPAISAARAQRRMDDMRETGVLGMRLASLMGMPCTVGLSLLSLPAIQFIYYRLPLEEQIVAGNILTLSALTIIVFIHVQATTGILQGAGMQKVPMLAMVVGVACKIGVNYVLVGSPNFNIYGAPIASIVCYCVALGVNLYWIVRKLGTRFAWGSIVFRPLLATAGMGVTVFLLMQVLDMGRKRNTLIAIAIGALVYAVLVFAAGALRREDMDQIPGGQKIERALVKLHIWRA